MKNPTRSSLPFVRHWLMPTVTSLPTRAKGAIDCERVTAEACGLPSLAKSVARSSFGGKAFCVANDGSNFAVMTDHCAPPGPQDAAREHPVWGNSVSA
jgi:hypothetical protein